jgi:predicted RNA binding protein YcfA (HicA-like mRNA interferase family)
MSKLEKLIQKILNGHSVSYEDAEKLLIRLGFDLNIRGSHHIFRKMDMKETYLLKNAQSFCHIK